MVILRTLSQTTLFIILSIITIFPRQYCVICTEPQQSENLISQPSNMDINIRTCNNLKILIMGTISLIEKFKEPTVTESDRRSYTVGLCNLYFKVLESSHRLRYIISGRSVNTLGCEHISKYVKLFAILYKKMASCDEKMKIFTATNVPESNPEYITTLATLRQQSKLVDITFEQNLEELIKYAMHAHPFIENWKKMIPEQCQLCGTSSNTLYRMCQHPLDIPCAIKLYVTNGKKCPFCNNGLFMFLETD